MPTAPQADFAIHALAAALPTGDAPPEWVTIFPKIGRIKTRFGGKSYTVDPEALAAAFAADGLDLPVDVNHAIDLAAPRGERSDAVGWLKEMRVQDGRLQARVEWLDEGRELIVSRKYRYVSPSFFADKDGRTLALKALSLVPSPALANQPALASAPSSTTKEERKMEKLAAALGLQPDASEGSLLAALSAGFVPKKNHDELVAQLAASETKLKEIEDAGRKARVDALIEGALKEKKILPAEKDHYAQLCATDSGFESVKALLAAKSSALGGSGLDKKKEPAADAPLTATQLAAKANKMVADGEAPDFLAAVSMLSAEDERRAAA